MHGRTARGPRHGSSFGRSIPRRHPTRATGHARPTPPESTHVIVANRPKSVQSDVIVTELLPDRHAPNWPADRVALQVLGGGPTGRLFLDVREKRSLAYRADARYLELAHDAAALLG